MIRYKTHSDNDEYIIIGIKTNISTLVFSEIDMPEKIKEELDDIYYGSHQYQDDNKYNGDVVIKKDSMLGEYLLNRFNEGNEDFNITHEKIRNALNIAMFEENEIFNSILPLFKNLVSERYENLKYNYDINVLNYIMSNSDFQIYIDKLTGKYQGRDDLIYDNGYYKLNLYNETKKQKKY